jgi:alpha-mannosidase
MLTIEWRRRIDNWRRELPLHLYRPLGEVDLKGFITTDQLTVDQALQRPSQPMPSGTRWGSKWEYGWFAGELTLPEEARGKRIALVVDVGGESAVYVDGIAVGETSGYPGAVPRSEPDRGWRRGGRFDPVILYHEVTLAKSAVPGTRYEIAIEAYAGHGPRVSYAGPTPPGRETVPEPPPAQATVGHTTYGVWQEEVYQLWLDVESLYEVRDNIDPELLRVAEIDAGLRDFSTLVDFELPNDAFLETVRACRERLRPLMECVNGSTAPTMYAFGHAHIDVAWLWPLAETERKCVRTFAAQLSLMEQYPDYKFLQSQPHLYQMVKDHYPKLYERIKKAVALGQFMPEGGMWVEADTNISGGESLIRQFIHGKRFFRDEFGVECELMWLPDVFGYSGAMPQIMVGCGIKYFSTQKIFWAYNGGDPFPYNTFWWEGIDGSQILVHLHNDYNSRMNPATVIERWKERVQKEGFSTRLMPFGFGDGGGGPTRNHIEYARRQRDLEGAPKVVIASPIDYFVDQESKPVENCYVGELYFQAHRGTYTSQARTKRGNRKSELALREAEMWGVAARALKGYTFPADTMDQGWKKVLLNQFHDIIPGSSIERVYDEAEAAYADVIGTADGVIADATAALVDGTQALTLFNSLPWARTVLAQLPGGMAGASDQAGHALPMQGANGNTWVEATVPPCGWTTLQPGLSAETGNTLLVNERLLENELIRVEFNGDGEIVRLYDKEADRELNAGVCNRFMMYKDVPTGWDAWDLDSMYAETPVELDAAGCVEVVAAGPLVAGLRVTRTLHHSTMQQEIRLRRGSRRIDFHTVIDWQEQHKLLKVNFPVNVHAHEALHEIQFGHLARPNHLSRPFDADRFEVSAHKWTALVEGTRGCAVLNDCKYGVNVLGPSINLTLLKSPLAPDMHADLGRQEFTYAFYAWNGPFPESDLVKEAYDLNVPVRIAAGAAGEQSLFWIDADNIVIETVKPAEDGSADVVVRMYESARTATHCTLHTTLPATAAVQTSMIEEHQAGLALSNGQIALQFRPFEVKTVRLSL